MKNKSLLIVIAIVLIALNTSAQVKIGTQTWATKNLDVSTFRNGDVIPEAKTTEEWIVAGGAGKPVWCYYDNDPENGKKYGKLYNWYAVNDPRGLAPKGWHVPNNAEWKMLITCLGGRDVAGKKLKASGGWEKNGNGTDSSGFAALPGGSRGYDGSSGKNAGGGTFWWSASDRETEGWYINVASFNDIVSMNTVDKGNGSSVRCIIDNIPGELRDIEGNSYKIIKIASQEWTVSNLMVRHFRNGDMISQVKTNEEWENAISNHIPAFCYYENDSANRKQYGMLYNWYAVHDPRGLAPAGWHIPSDSEWTVLVNALGGAIEAGGKMKEAGNSHWISPNTGATNNSGFTGLPGGYRGSSGFHEMGKYGFWWTSGEYDSLQALSRGLSYDTGGRLHGQAKKENCLSVRCVKD